MNKAITPFAVEHARISDIAAFEARLLAKKAWDALATHPDAEFVDGGFVTRQPGVMLDQDLSRKKMVILLDGVIYETGLAQSISSGCMLGLRPNLDSRQPVTKPEDLICYSRMSIEALAAHADQTAPVAAVTTTS